MDVSIEILSHCRNGNVNTVHQLLNEGISPDIQDSEGVTPLQMAAANGWDDIICLLLSCGAQVDLANIYGWTPLMHAALHGHTVVISRLLRNHAKVNVCNKLGLQPIVSAAWNGHVSAVKILLEAGAVIDHPPSGISTAESDMSALMAASLKGHDVVVRTLLEKGACVNLASPISGMTPLMCAACNGFKQVIQVIAEWGGDANKLDICERTAQDIATVRSKREVKAYLENMTATWPKVGIILECGIFQAVRNGDISQVKVILQQDPGCLNIVDSVNGATPLIIASMLGHLEIVCLLVSLGADVDVPDCTNGWTAIMHAVFSRHVKVAEYLLYKGANLDVQAKNGYTVLDLVYLLDDADSSMSHFLSVKPKYAHKLSANYSLPVPTESEKVQNTTQFPTKPCSQQGRLKGWFDGLTQHFNNSKLNKLSSKTNDTCMPEMQVLEDSSVDDVFINDNLACKAPKARLSLSSLLSPNRHLSESLRKHSLEPVSPPLLSSPTWEMERDQKNSKGKFYQERLYKSPGSISALQIPNLLKSHEKRFSSSKSQQFFIEYSGHAKSDQDHLSFLLEQKSLQKYIQKFKDQEIDMEAFQYLNEDDLEELGIYSTLSRQKILEIISHAQNAACDVLSQT